MSYGDNELDDEDGDEKLYLPKEGWGMRSSSRRATV